MIAATAMSVLEEMRKELETKVITWTAARQHARRNGSDPEELAFIEGRLSTMEYRLGAVDRALDALRRDVVP